MIDFPPLEGEPGDMGYWMNGPEGRVWVKWDEPMPDWAYDDDGCPNDD